MSDTNKRHSTTRKVSLKEDVRTAVYREINRKLTREEIGELEFCKDGGGWVGKVTKPRHDLTTFKRLSDKKHHQKSSQISSQKIMENKRSTPNSNNGSQIGMNSSSRPSTAPVRVEYSDSDGETEELSTDDVDMEELFKSRPIIEDPFSGPQSTEGDSSAFTVWRSPEMANKKTSFSFDRPSHEKLASFTSPTAHVSRLQAIIEEKDKQISILQTQLLKIHKESSILAEEVAKRKGPDANQLQRDNRLMREQLDRCMKENTILRGINMQSKNTTLKKLQKQRDMENRHSCLSVRQKNSSSRYTDDGSMSSGYISSNSSRSKVGVRSVSFSPCPNSLC